MTVAVVVPWRDTGCVYRQRAWSWVRRRWWALHPDIEFATTSSPPGPFNIAAALNAGVACCTADVVVLTGADTVLDPDDVRAAVELASEGWVMLARRYLRMHEWASADLTAAPVDTAPTDGGEVMPTQRGWGPIVAPRALLLDVPYDERFTGWGGEDDAFGAAAEALHGPARHVGGTAHLLWHPRHGPDHADYPANLALLRRYLAADRNPTAMRSLMAEANQ